MARSKALNRSDSEQFVIKSKQTNKNLRRMKFSKTLLMAGILAAKSTQAVSLKQEAQGTDITPLQVFESMIDILIREIGGVKNYIDNEVQALQTRDETLQAENASLRERVEENETRITDYETNFEDLNGVNADLEAQIESLQG